MSQLGNYPCQSSPDTDSVPKSGSPAVANGQSSTIPHAQNGLQSPHFTGTPSSQSSRDPSRETSRDPSPTQYLRNTVHQSLYRPERRSQMPAINGRQQSFPQNSSSISLFPRVPQLQKSSPISVVQTPHNLSGVSGVTAVSSEIPSVGLQPQINSQPSSLTKPMSTPKANLEILHLENKVPESEISESIPPLPQGSYSSESNHICYYNNSNEESQEIQSKVQSQSSSQTMNSLANVQNQPTVQNQEHLQNLSKFLPGGQVPDYEHISNSCIVQNPSFSHHHLNQNLQQPHQQNVNLNVQLSKHKKSLESQSGNPVIQTSQPSTLPRSQSQNFEATNSASNQLPYQSKITSQNLFSNVNAPPIQNVNSAPMMLTKSQPVSQIAKTGSSPKFALANKYGMQPPMQNIQKGPCVENIQNSQQNFLGGQSNSTGELVLPQNKNLYSSQQNLTSQINYSQNSYDAQLRNTSLSGPTPTNQRPVLLSQTQSRPPFSGIPPPAIQQQNLYDTRPPHCGQMSNIPLDNISKRYPSSYPDQLNQLNNQMSSLNVTQTGFNKLWGMESVDLLQCRNILPAEKVDPPKIKLHQEFLDRVNCSPDIFRCTLSKIPESNSLLQKSRLPLGVLIHPFKDLYHLAVIQCSTIVRCRACRTYINPFVYFVDAKRWKCNLCYRVNELPDEFQFDPATKSYGDPSRRPEVKTSTIEFIAPSEYMLRPPQPAVYLFVLDVSRLAVESGYLTVVCKAIASELSKMPGDGRMQVGFIAVDSAIHFFSIPDGVSQPHELIMLDVEDVFLPCPENLIINIKEREDLVRDLLAQLPTKFQGTHDTQSALGAGLQAAYKLMAPTGGRITVFQTCLPNSGPGALQPREDPNIRASKDVPHLNPVTDFYKRLALDCSSQQIAVDLFLLNCQYSDLATLSGMCKFSGGCIYHLPLFRTSKPQNAETLDRMLRRYLTRKIGFEAVMRIRCTRGLSIHTFHGNFFVRSTDLLSLPNVNPDAGFGMQVSIDENLSDVQNICFQAALLYTSSKGERRIRVHTLCLPVTNSLTDILHSADSQCIVGLLSKMAVDRSLQSSLSDARDALINAAIDVLSAYKLSQSCPTGGLLVPENLKLLPLYIIALLKSVAFRSGMNTRLDDRVFAMCQLKTLPLSQLIQTIYPDLYPVHSLDEKLVKDVDGRECPQPPRLHLSAEKLDSKGAFLLDAGDKILIYVGKNISPIFCSNVFSVPAFTLIPEEMYDLPELSTTESERLRNFVFSLQEDKPYYATIQIVRDDSHFKTQFTERLVEDRFESALSYYEFLQHLKPQIK